jgi:hypothetical protein
MAKIQVATAESDAQDAQVTETVELNDELNDPSLMGEYEEARETGTGALASSNPRMDRWLIP